jgi:hypothetical protein
MFILGLLHRCAAIPCRGCLKRASAAAVQCRAAPQGLSMLVRASAVDHGWSFEVQSTATEQQCLGLRPKTGRRGAWLNVGGILASLFSSLGLPRRPALLYALLLLEVSVPQWEVHRREQPSTFQRRSTVVSRRPLFQPCPEKRPMRARTHSRSPVAAAATQEIDIARGSLCGSLLLSRHRCACLLRTADLVPVQNTLGGPGTAHCR